MMRCDTMRLSQQHDRHPGHLPEKTRGTEEISSIRMKSKAATRGSKRRNATEQMPFEKRRAARWLHATDTAHASARRRPQPLGPLAPRPNSVTHSVTDSVVRPGEPRSPHPPSSLSARFPFLPRALRLPPPHHSPPRDLAPRAPKEARRGAAGWWEGTLEHRAAVLSRRAPEPRPGARPGPRAWCPPAAATRPTRSSARGPGARKSLRPAELREVEQRHKLRSTRYETRHRTKKRRARERKGN